MILKKQFLLVFLIANIFTMHSQTSPLTKKDSTIVSSWIFGVGFNVVDDSDDTFNRLFDFKSAWNAVPYPSRISVGNYFKNGLGIEGILSYNKYKKGKIADGLPVDNDKDYFSIDSRLSYDLNKIIGYTGWFDPYLGIGAGFTHANDISRGTFNAVLGFRTWFSDKFGLDVNTSGKWTMNTNYTNHLQHVLGVVYRFDFNKELTKKGEEKLKLITAEENEALRINDSILLANKQAEEARFLAEKLVKEKEALRLAQLEKERTDLKNEIQNKIDTLENIYFPLDTSTLTKSSKDVLNKLMLILNEYPKLTLEITSHTDSRGSEIYNQKLSECRLKSTLDYLFEKGIETNRITGGAFGENRLVNECDDNVKCPEVKHKQNRRSEIKIINY